MNLKELKKELNVKDVRNSEKTLEDLSWDIGFQILRLRIERGLTQEELAAKVGTKQPSIARLENGSVAPSFGFLFKVVKAMDAYLLIPEIKSNDQ